MTRPRLAAASLGPGVAALRRHAGRDAPRTATISTAPGPSAALSLETLNQVAADLGALDMGLYLPNSDLNNPQGDS
jgi:hypothetical protein